MEQFDESIKVFNAEQKEAIKVNKNTVVSAGAGSGKTKTLSTRYVRLIIEDKVEVEEILALTFTKKAAIEMYGRIYSELQRFENNPYAKKAIENFQKAKISTLDSFCNSILRYSCRSYGIRPDFSIDEYKSKKIANDLATSFFLKNIKEPCLKELVSSKDAKKTISDLFVKVLSNYVTIAKPLNLTEMLEKQKELLEAKTSEVYNEIQEIIEGIRNLEDSDVSMVINAKAIVNELSEVYVEKMVDIENEENIKLFNAHYSLSKVKLSTSKKDIAVLCKSLLEDFRIAFNNLINICNYNLPLTKDIFRLLDELQKEYINAKITQGILTYNDVSHLALESLKNDVELRNYYKKNIKTIMIDEFQDNNQLQRDILFLLAEKQDRKEKTIPISEELEEGKLFFVGDEKQSIYAFRGADVSVFRSLIKDLKNEIKLTKNYRTEKPLIDVFNAIFSYVFYSEKNTYEDIPSYEATFEDINHFQENKEVNADVEVLYFDSSLIKNKNANNIYLTDTDTEAFFLAKRIKTLYDERFQVKDKTSGKTRDCMWSDFAILLRASTNQGYYERYLKMFGVPYTASSQKNIFNYAPINDIYSMFRLAVYPKDDFCYAQVLKTPLVNISDLGFAKIMIEKKDVFSNELDDVLNEDDAFSFKRGREVFEKIKEALKTKNNAEVITMLIFEYRYLLLSNSSYQHFIELYDYLFYLATLADQSNMPHFEFVDLLQDYTSKGENKVEEMDIPVNQKKDSVKIMTVHKSKGLEFPIVIIPNCDNKGQGVKKEGMVFYSKEIGLSIHTPDNFSQYRASNDTKTNFFFEMLREEENKKLLAETKRLFYVAMTRAEIKLILSGCFEAENNALEYDAISAETNKKLSIKTIEEFLKIAPMPKKELHSFFDLLTYALIKTKQSSNDIEKLKLFFFELPVIARKDLIKTMKTKDKTIAEHIEYYEKLEVKEFLNNDEPLSSSAKGSIDEKEDKNLIFDQNEKPIQLGEIAHSMLEAALNNQTFDISSFKLEDEEVKLLEKYKNNFLFSELGQKALSSSYRKTEYGFITKYQGKEDDSPKITRGVIDLFFEYENVLYIVDYKTDKKESNKYYRQLSVYKKAVSDLWQHLHPNKQIEIKTILFYLHLNKTIEI
ncbi:MAG: UvrD-helicase domain-containing protein [Treponema sp.]